MALPSEIGWDRPAGCRRYTASRAVAEQARMRTVVRLLGRCALPGPSQSAQAGVPVLLELASDNRYRGIGQLDGIAALDALRASRGRAGGVGVASSSPNPR